MTFLHNLRILAVSALFAVVMGNAAFALAQDSDDEPMGLMPPQATITIDASFDPAEETHPPLRLTPDKTQIIELDEPVSRVIIGGETHINVLTDTATRIIVVPRVPGAGHFTVLGPNGKVMMKRHVIVASPAEQYVRIRMPCHGSRSCNPVRVFYCPGMCHEVAVVGQKGSAFSGSMAGDYSQDGDSDADENETQNDNQNNQGNNNETNQDQSGTNQ